MNERAHAPYRAELNQTRDDIIAELRMLITGRSAGNIRCMLSSNMVTRRDGSFYSNPDEPKDSGAAVWWIDNTGATCAIACDAWTTVQGNFRAIALNIRHMRAVQRTRASQIFGRMSQSFRVHTLVANNPISRPDCADRLGLPQWPVSRDALDAHFRKLAKTTHPDCGVDDQEFKEISRAHAECARLLVAG